MRITSLQNPRVRAAARLRDRRHRQMQGRILIDGTREILRGLEGGLRLIEVFVCKDLCRDPLCGPLLDRLIQAGAEVLEVAPPVFEKLAFGHRAEGLLAVAEMPLARLADLVLRGDPLVAVLERVEKPGNVGAVLRTADAVGVSALIVTDAQTDLYNPNAIRASLGTIFTLPVAQATTEETLSWLRSRRLTIFAARVDAAMPYTEADFRGPAAIVLGNEAEGLTSAWSGSEIRAVSLPMRGAADSLNVSATAAVLFYEALRQRGSTTGRPC
jgi:TrmH family RNA methyltransferase